jgi:hypothetical protein
MWKLFTPVLGAGLLLTLSASAGDTGLRPPRLPSPGPIRPFPPDGIIKTVIAEVKGTLRRVEVPGKAPEGFPIRDKKDRKGIWCHVFEITAAGKTYRLDLRGVPRTAGLAEALIGKKVLVVGAVEERLQLHGIHDKDGIAIMTCPENYRALVVRRLQPIETDSVRETVEVEAHGILSYWGRDLEDRPVAISPIPGAPGYFLTVGRRQYRLDLGNDPKLAEKAKANRGLPVLVTGRLETRVELIDLTGATRTYQVIVVTGLTPLDLIHPELCGTRPR